MPVLLQFAQKNDQLELMTGFAFKSTPASLRRSSNADAAAKQTGDMHNPCGHFGGGVFQKVHINRYISLTYKVKWSVTMGKGIKTSKSGTHLF